MAPSRALPRPSERVPISPATREALEVASNAAGVSASAVASALFVTLFADEEDLRIVDASDRTITPPAIDELSVAGLAQALSAEKQVRLSASDVRFDADRGELETDGSPALLRLIVRRLEASARAAARDPSVRALTLPTTSDEERAELEARSRGPIVPIPAGTPADDVRRHARRAPTAPALGDARRTFDYASLDAAIDAVVANLVARGVGSGDRVGVVLDRGAPVVVVMLALFRLGAIYVPVNPAYPTERIAFMLADAGCALVVHDATASGLDGGAVAKLHVDDALASPPAAPRELAAVDGSAGAYIIYTSGSTGTPKGVELSHQAFRNTIASKVALLAVGPNDRFLAVMSTAFDASIFEFCMPILAGSFLYVADSAVAADFDALARLVDDLEVSVMGATPPTWRGLFATDWRPRRRLRVMAGGEALPSSLATELARHFRAFNMYGLTETAITSTAFEIDARPLGTKSPIGLPLPNAIVRVADRFGRMVPIGNSGELYIGGVGLATGYRGKPELTRERFGADPLGREEGRFFRTGDRVRVREDGLLEFRDRLDSQVKVHGARVELGEIEARLETDPNVAAAAVICEGDVGDERLVAFVTRRSEVAADALRRAVRAFLPEHAVPSEFVFVDSLPMTTNGKIDRRALAAMPRARGASEVEANANDASTGGVLGVVVAAVAKIARVASIDADAPLGDLGVDSVGRARLKRALLERGLSVAYVHLMGAPTARTIAAAAETTVADAKRTPEAVSSANRLERALDNQRFPSLVHLANPGRGAWNCQLAFTIEGALDADRLIEAWRMLIARHDTLRLSFPWRGQSHPQVTIADAVDLRFERIVVREKGRAAGDARVAVQERELATQFDLERAPLFRVALVELSPTAHEMVWTYFSALFDGWSSAIVLRELFAIYDALGTGDVERWTKPAPSFFEHLSRFNQRSWDAAAAFFARELEGYVRPPPLASSPGGTDEERDVARLPEDERALFVAMNERPFWVERPGHQELPFSTLLRDRLEATAAASGVGMASLLLATWGAVLMRELDRTDVLVGMVAASRPDFEEAIGKYTSVLPFRIRMSGAPTLVDWLRAMQDHVARVHEHEQTPVRAWVRNVVTEPWHMAFESSFTFVNYARTSPRPRSSDVTVAQMRQVEGGIPPVFGMVVIPGDPGVLRLEYNARCNVDPARAARMLATFAELLGALRPENLGSPASSLLEGSFGGARFGVPITLV